MIGEQDKWLVITSLIFIRKKIKNNEETEN